MILLFLAMVFKFSPKNTDRFYSAVMIEFIFDALLLSWAFWKITDFGYCLLGLALVILFLLFGVNYVIGAMIDEYEKAGGKEDEHS